MGAWTKIEWAMHTFNLWWGCVKVSPGCENCYAEASSMRWGYDIWGPGAERRMLSDNHWNQLRKWNRNAEKAAERHRVFVGSMMDWAEIHRDPIANEMLNLARERFFNLAMECKSLDFLMLTKRPENMPKVLPAIWRHGVQGNMWLGTSAEDQKRFDSRIVDLMAVSAPVHFISYEPALGPLKIGGAFRSLDTGLGRGVNWVIAGAESGNGARPMDEQWVRDMRAECRAAGVPFFYKQKLVGRKKVSLPMLDGQQFSEVPA